MTSTTRRRRMRLIRGEIIVELLLFTMIRIPWDGPISPYTPTRRNKLFKDSLAQPHSTKGVLEYEGRPIQPRLAPLIVTHPTN